MCVDHKGYLWISTGNGLNCFNGKSVEHFFATEHSPMINSNVMHVTCDSSNQIWLMTLGGHVSMIDDKRQFHSVAVFKNGQKARTAWILNTLQNGIILWTNQGFFQYKSNITIHDNDSLSERCFTPFTINGFDQLGPKGFRQVFLYDDDQYLFVRDDGFYKVDFKTRKVEKKYVIPNCNALIKWGSNGLLYSDILNYKIRCLNLSDEKISEPFQGITDQYGQAIQGFLRNAARLNENQYLFTTKTSGIYIYSMSNHSMFNSDHVIVDPSSISSDGQSSITVHSNGWVLLACDEQGISYFNTKEFIGSKATFYNRGAAYDNYIAGIATRDNNTFYLGTRTGMLRWKRNTDETQFIDVKDKNNISVFKDQDVTSIAIDDQGKIWFSIYDFGLYVIDKNHRYLKHFQNNGSNKTGFKQKKVGRVILGPDHYIWTCGRNGISRINPENFEIDNFENTPLAKFDSMHVVPLHFIDQDNLLIAASFQGLFQYNFKTKILKEIEAFNKYKVDGILDLETDRNRNIYVANRKGLTIISPQGLAKHIDQRDGLLSDQVEGLLYHHDKIWIGNDVGLACYDPSDSALKTFDERFGLSIFGFRLASYFQAPNGEFILGTPRGIQYFEPDSLLNKTLDLNVSITKIETKKVNTNISRSDTFRLSPTDDQITFHFNSIDYNPHKRTYYQYKLIDLDKEWINLVDQSSVRYNSLKPGKYKFKVRVSNDKKAWKDSYNEVYIELPTPLIATWWFKSMALLFSTVTMGFVLNYFRTQQKQKQKLAIELLENKQKVTESRLQSLRLQMNPHFLFNALNSIQQMILSNEEMVATRYLSRFSKLLRAILTHSDKETISLREEMDMLKMYIELEAVRFKDSFSYKIDCDEEIELDEIKIPTLLIQPFVENAIWHGLMHKEGDRNLKIRFEEKGDILQCSILDNGVGRKKSTEIKNETNKIKMHSSKGISVSEERIKTFRNSQGHHGSIAINDLVDDHNQGIGTEVIINFPI